MKFVVAIILLLLLSAGVWAYSLVWSVDRTPLGEPAISLNGLYVAQFYSMPETSEKPYGHGVYVRYRFVPAWVKSTDVFAGYCGQNEHLNWLPENRLVVHCHTPEDMPILKAPPAGISVDHTSGRS